MRDKEREGQRVLHTVLHPVTHTHRHGDGDRLGTQAQAQEERRGEATREEERKRRVEESRGSWARAKGPFEVPCPFDLPCPFEVPCRHKASTPSFVLPSLLPPTPSLLPLRSHSHLDAVKQEERELGDFAVLTACLGTFGQISMGHCGAASE